MNLHTWLFLGPIIHFYVFVCVRMCVCVAKGHNSSDYIHVLVEAVRLALTDALRYLGDSSHVTIPLETLLDKGYSHQRAQLISTDRCVFLRVYIC